MAIWIPRVTLAAFLISNISALPEHYRIARTGHLQGYMAAAPYLLKAIKELNNTPEAAPSGKKFDAKKLANSGGDWTAILKNPLEHPNMSANEFVFSSHFYNFLRSQRNLDFRQPGDSR